MDLSAPPPPGTLLRLADHVRACSLNDQVVLLDLRRSRYLAIRPAHWAQLTGGIDPGPDGSPCPAFLVRDSDTRLAAPLLRQGLLTGAPARQPRNPSPPLPPPVDALDVQVLPALSAVGARRSLRIAGAVIRAAAALRLRSLEHIASRMARRAAPSDASGTGPDACLHDAVAAFLALRPFLLTARDRCLHDSIALATCLADERIACRWVIGVRSRPFAAHAWVQAGGVVLNDLLENVRRYRPILVV